LSAGIELLAKLHDVDTLRTQSRAYGRGGVGSATLDLQFDLSSNFFSHFVTLNLEDCGVWGLGLLMRSLGAKAERS
jgi:hypothetical protein